MISIGILIHHGISNMVYVIVFPMNLFYLSHQISRAVYLIVIVCVKNLCRRESFSSCRIWCKNISLLFISINLIGIRPISKYSMTFGVPFPVSKTFLINCSSTFSSSSISLLDTLYHTSELVSMLFIRREFLRILATSNWNGPKQISSRIVDICLIFPYPQLPSTSSCQWTSLDISCIFYQHAACDIFSPQSVI